MPPDDDEEAEPDDDEDDEPDDEPDEPEPDEDVAPDDEPVATGPPLDVLEHPATAEPMPTTTMTWKSFFEVVMRSLSVDEATHHGPGRQAGQPGSTTGDALRRCRRCSRPPDG